MKRIIFGESIQGFSHKLSNTECQDSYKKVEFDDGTFIMAIADGHGSKACPFSKSGSSIAVNVFCKVLGDLHDCYTEKLESLLTFLNREGDTKVALAVDSEWKRRVLQSHKNNRREVPLTSEGLKDKQRIYKLYGSTLVGIMVTPIFYFAFQLGDGDISFVDDNGFEKVLQAEKILGTETYSLSKIGSWKDAISLSRRRKEDTKKPYVFIVTTDGFANSYENEDEFGKTCVEYFEMLKQHGADAVICNLRNWLMETSEKGCGDDITILVAYFYDEDVLINI